MRKASALICHVIFLLPVSSLYCITVRRNFVHDCSNTEALDTTVNASECLVTSFSVHTNFSTCVSNFTRLMAREITNNNFEISLVVFMPNITTNHAIICLYYYNGVVIFTCRYLKLSWNTTALSQSNWRNSSCDSVTHVIPHSHIYTLRQRIKLLGNVLQK